MKDKIILASRSNVRKYILNENGINCEVIPSNIDEEEVKNSETLCVIGLTAEPSRILDVRKNRLNFINEKRTSSYTDIKKIKLELKLAINIFKKNNWPIIDVTRKSVEETAASIIKIYDIIYSR